MKECKDDAILPCYRDGYGVWHHLDDTHEKVYELNRQMCDLDIPLRNPIKPVSEETVQELIGKWEAIGKEWASKKKEIVESILGNITIEKSNIMEKKTKKMTKAEAFEYFKGKRVACDECDIKDIQRKLFEVGIMWRGGSTKVFDCGKFLFINLDCQLSHANCRTWFDAHEYEEISADDILSIEILEDKNNEFVDCREPCPEIKAVQELLRNSKHLKDKIIVITKDNAAIL